MSKVIIDRYINRAQEINIKNYTELEEACSYALLEKEDKKFIRFTDYRLKNLVIGLLYAKKLVKKSTFDALDVAFYFDEQEDENELIFKIELLKGFSNTLLTAGKKIHDEEVVQGGLFLLEYYNEYHDGLSPISWDELSSFYIYGKEVSFDLLNNKVAGTVSHTEINSYMSSTSLNVYIDIISIAAGEPTSEKVKVLIDEYDGKVEPSSLPVVMLTKKLKKSLKDKNSILLDRLKSSNYLMHEGMVSKNGFFGPVQQYHSGRTMIDPEACHIVDSQLYSGLRKVLGISSLNEMSDAIGEEPISDSEKWKLLPFSISYSLSNKKWGLVYLHDCREIKFRDDAFDFLVMDESRKEMLIALTNREKSEFTDLIDDKGGGSIILLHGDPGQGKTLSAEALAERLKKPLYKISVGELGTNAVDLEESLETILDIAERWGAILLIDEADIFLESRNSSDIERNSMVAIFLKLLEYYSGILFLTTNRVKNFDPAFHSRITLALNFEAMDQEARSKVWQNLLLSAKITGIDVSRLAHFNVNGRQIKNALISANNIAVHRKEPLSTEHVVEMLRNSTEFALQIGD